MTTIANFYGIVACGTTTNLQCTIHVPYQRCDALVVVETGLNSQGCWPNGLKLSAVRLYELAGSAVTST